MIVLLRGELEPQWRGQDLFALVCGLRGEVVRAQEGRRTMRFTVSGRGYYCKLHTGVGWREIAKNLLQGRPPILSATHEWRALESLAGLHVHTPHWVAYGRRGHNPARLCSFLITEELSATRSLEEHCARWAEAPPPFALRRALLEEVARITRVLHNAGINHRDLYLCHFLLQDADGAEQPDTAEQLHSAAQPNAAEQLNSGGQPDAAEQPNSGAQELRLYLIDLHRAQLRRKVPPRWRAKDLAGLYFSAYDALGGSLSRQDTLRFLRTYFRCPPRLLLRRHARLLHRSKKRAQRFYLQNHPRLPNFPL